jgi:DNA invertase Pin-like site-specific DNA recombinase
VLSILATIAKQERVRLSERVKAGLDRARAQGKAVGRPKIVVDRAKVLELHGQGLSQWDISQRLGVSRASVGRIVAERSSGTV